MYDQMIRESVARQGRIGIDPAQVEAWMRLEHGTLDGLSRSRWEAEIAAAIACVDSDPVASARLAQSFGLPWER